MKVSDYLLQSIASWIGLIVLYSIPIIRSVMGEPLPVIALAITIIAGFGFGLLGGYYFDQYKKENK